MSGAVHIAGGFLSTDPLITISKCEDGHLGIPDRRRDLFRGRKALHLLGLCWTVEDVNSLQRVVTDLSELAADLGGNSFVILANTEFEAYLLGEAGVPALVANELMFIDERRFVPTDGHHERFEPGDAVYCARLAPEKRHELAALVPHPIFVYPQFDPGGEDRYRRIRALMPHATFANHELGGGAYRWLGYRDVCSVMNRCRVGLCLSAAEGAMRASMEYLMCGLPIVSTPSQGGRDRYFGAPFCTIVEPEPAAVAEAVRTLAARNLDKRRIRYQAGQMVGFDRHNFLINVNRLTRAVFGADRLFPSFEPFIGRPVIWRREEQVFAELDAPSGPEGPGGQA